jgi:hypothetical protein
MQKLLDRTLAAPDVPMFNELLGEKRQTVLTKIAETFREANHAIAETRLR